MKGVEADRYSLHVFPDEENGGNVAVCPEFPGVSGFGDSPEEAVREVRIALELAIETYLEEGWPLPEPLGLDTQELPSGEFRVRLPRSMHAQLSRRAAEEGVSQNHLVIAYMAAGLAGRAWSSRTSAPSQRTGKKELVRSDGS